MSDEELKEGLEKDLEITFGNEKEEKADKKEEKDKPKFCKKCGAKMPKDTKFCPKCGAKQEEENKCPGCGAKITKQTKFCDKCGFRLNEDEVKPKDDKPIQTTNQVPKKSHALAIILSVVGGIIFILLLIGVIIGISIKKNIDYEKTPVKVDVSMSEWYGSIDYILEDFGLDFDLVTKGGNCYSGVQTGSFETEKYGILHTEYSYCKSNKTLTLRVYNLEADQKLREPKNGEVPEYDMYGKRKSDYSI